MSLTDTYLGRQPILNVRQSIVAYALLFRSGRAGESGVMEDLPATATVIVNTISQIGIDTVLGKQSGLVKVSYELMMSDMVELLPRDRVVLEIMNSVEIDDRAVMRCHELKSKGFRLALDDVEYTPAHDALFEVIDIVKVDIKRADRQGIDAMLQLKRRWPQLQLLADKVEERSQFQDCVNMGFTLFQGYFFARPAVISGKKATPSQLTLLRVINQLMSDVELAEIELSFKASPNLIVGLLRLVNSVAMGLRSKVGTLHQALVILGRRQLQRWVQLLLYAQDDGSMATNPLMQLAATRARTMEILIQNHPDSRYHAHDACDRAFLIGMLSLVDAVLGMEMDEILGQLGLADEVTGAILQREGVYGQLLTLVEKIETSDFSGISLLRQSLGLSQEDLNGAGMEAMQWVSGLGEEVGN